MIREILIAAAVGWIVSEGTDISPRLAIRLVRWAAVHLYCGDAERAERRREEWEALIDGAIPSKTLKLVFGLSFGCAGLYRIVIRRAPLVLAATGRGIHKALAGIAEMVMAGISVEIANLPGLWGPIVIGGMLPCSASWPG